MKTKLIVHAMQPVTAIEGLEACFTPLRTTTLSDVVATFIPSTIACKREKENRFEAKRKRG